MRRLILLTMMCGTLLLPIGCSGIFAPRIEPHPDAPLLVTKTFGGFVQVAVYDKDRNAMVPAGWAWIGRYDGWTLHKFKWADRIDTETAKREAAGIANAGPGPPDTEGN